MTDLLRHVQRGDPFRIPASTFNAFVDAAQDYRSRQLGNGGSKATPAVRDADVVFVKNVSGETRVRFDVLGIDGPIIEPKDNSAEFKNRVALVGSLPKVDKHFGKFVIMAESAPSRDPAPDTTSISGGGGRPKPSGRGEETPFKGGVLARSWISGGCPVRIDVLDEAHKQADIAEDVATHLVSNPAGTAQILWKEAGLGIKWAIVRLGSPAESSLVVFPTATVGGKIAAKAAVKNESGAWVFAPGDAVQYPIPPGYTTAHFNRLLVAGNPTATSQVCMVQNGMIWPHWRFLLVQPPAAAECDVG